MGSKSSHFYQADRPESGGANKDDIKDKTGLHERDKQKFSAHRADLKENMVPQAGDNPEQSKVRNTREQADGTSGETASDGGTQGT